MTDSDMKRLLNRKKLIQAGLYPRYIDCGSMEEEKKSTVDYKRIPFSKYYNTYEEYVKAVDKIMVDAGEGKDLDDNELSKIAKTQEELEIGLWGINHDR